MANFASKEGTLGAGVAQTFNFKALLGVNASSLVYSNDDASSTHTLILDGQSMTVKPSEQRVLSGVQNWDVLTIGGDAGSTGAYRVYASSDEPAPLFYKPYGGPVTTAGLADGSVTDPKLAKNVHVASAGTIGSPSPVVTLQLEVASAAGPTYTVSYTGLSGKHEIIGVSVVQLGAGFAANSYKLQTSAAADITDAMTTGLGVGVVKYAGSLANTTLLDAAGLKVLVTNGGGAGVAAAKVIITLVPVA